MSDIDLHRRLLALERAVDDLRAREQAATPFRFRFTALKTSSQTIPANMFTLVTWNNVIEDTTGAYNSSTHTLTLPAGWYVCTCKLLWGLTAQTNQELIVTLFRNGNRWRDGNRVVIPFTGRYISTSGVWLIPSGQYSIYVVHISNTAPETIFGGGAHLNWWHVWRVA